MSIIEVAVVADAKLRWIYSIAFRVEIIVGSF
jgi:hypothetical protein